jgi:hypothetical protein
MVETSADAGAGPGVWQNFEEFRSAAGGITDLLRAAVRVYCGAAIGAPTGREADESSALDSTPTCQAPLGPRPKPKSAAQQVSLVRSAPSLTTRPLPP